MSISFRVVLIALPLSQATDWKFIKEGNGGAANSLTLEGVGAGAFDPSRIANFVLDLRAPLIAPKEGGSCPGNIYNANPVVNGGAINVFFGGWDGVSSCHDSISVAVTMDHFQSFGEHVPVVTTGNRQHVNNPSALRRPDGRWAMLYTQLPQTAPPLNKPGFSESTDGVAFVPSAGGAAQLVQVKGYAGWDEADVNGGNVLYYTPPASGVTAPGQYDMYFVDFNNRNHSVYHAVAPASAVAAAAAAPIFSYVGVAMEEPHKIVNDIKRINGHWVLALHANGQQTFVSVTSEGATGAAAAARPPSKWPPTRILFEHSGEADYYIVSCGLVVDEASKVLKGALYGAGAVPQLDNNRIFATWLQRRAIFRSADNATAWGLGDAARAQGVDAVQLATNAPSLRGRWYLYDADYTDEARPGTLLAVSELVDVLPGEVWRVSEQ